MIACEIRSCRAGGVGMGRSALLLTVTSAYDRLGWEKPGRSTLAPGRAA
jgi:hypothetical protein